MAGQYTTMAAEQLSFQQCKVVLKWYWKFENMCEVQIQWLREFAMEHPTGSTTASVHDKFEVDDTVHDVQKQRYGRPRTATRSASSAMVLNSLQTQQKSAKQCTRETGICRSCSQHIRKRAKRKVYIPRLLYAMNVGDPGLRVNSTQPKDEFVSKIVWSHEAPCRLNGTVNRHDCVYRAPAKFTHSCGQGSQFIHCLVWTVMQGFNWTVLFLRNSYRPCVPQHASDIYFTCHASALWE
jgi:hypothetical protein